MRQRASARVQKPAVSSARLGMALPSRLLDVARRGWTAGRGTRGSDPALTRRLRYFSSTTLPAPKLKPVGIPPP